MAHPQKEKVGRQELLGVVSSEESREENKVWKEEHWEGELSETKTLYDILLDRVWFKYCTPDLAVSFCYNFYLSWRQHNENN